jgi:hypothetical protein
VKKNRPVTAGSIPGSASATGGRAHLEGYRSATRLLVVRNAYVPSPVCPNAQRSKLRRHSVPCQAGDGGLHHVLSQGLHVQKRLDLVTNEAFRLRPRRERPGRLWPEHDRSREGPAHKRVNSSTLVELANFFSMPAGRGG